MLVQRGAAAAVAAVAVPIIFLGFERVRTADASIIARTRFRGRKMSRQVGQSVVKTVAFFEFEATDGDRPVDIK